MQTQEITFITIKCILLWRSICYIKQLSLIFFEWFCRSSLLLCSVVIPMYFFYYYWSNVWSVELTDFDTLSVFFRNSCFAQWFPMCFFCYWFNRSVSLISSCFGSLIVYHPLNARNVGLQNGCKWSLPKVMRGLTNSPMCDNPVGSTSNYCYLKLVAL